MLQSHSRETSFPMNEIELKEVPVITQEWSIERIAKERTPMTWEKPFEECAKTFQHIDNILKNKKEIYPLKRHIFRAFELTRADNVKVCLLGEDPYPQLLSNGKPKAIGLSFSIDHFDRSIPVSLRNIFAEIERSYPETNHTSGSLINWSKQGVLLINSALTLSPEDIEKGIKHVDIWKHFVSAALKEICSRNDNFIVILLGRHAQSYAPCFKRNAKILQTSHPSRYSVKKGFEGSNIFKQCNELLIEMDKKPIDWST